MKKVIFATALVSTVIAAPVWADGASALKSRLDKVASFHASFTQKVTDAGGAAVQEGQGELWVKRPDLFNWHMTQPDESVLVSDGKTLWFYNPFVEQVSASWLKRRPVIHRLCSSPAIKLKTGSNMISASRAIVLS